MTSFQFRVSVLPAPTNCNPSLAESRNESGPVRRSCFSEGGSYRLKATQSDFSSQGFLASFYARH